MRAWALSLALLVSACATKGHIATPDEVMRLQQSGGLSSSGRITLSGPRGRVSARLVFGAAAPDSLRIEIPAGTGLRFLLVARNGRLRAELPQDDAMFEGASTREVMNGLFGIDLAPADLVSALLGSPPESMKVGWRFKSSQPAQITIHGANDTQLSVALDDPELQAPREDAFRFGPPRGRSWTLQEMSDRLGLRR